jgi:hypothetical protein
LYYKIADALPLLLQAELEQFLDQVRPLWNIMYEMSQL